MRKKTSQKSKNREIKLLVEREQKILEPMSSRSVLFVITSLLSSALALWFALRNDISPNFQKTWALVITVLFLSRSAISFMRAKIFSQLAMGESRDVHKESKKLRILSTVWNIISITMLAIFAFLFLYFSASIDKITEILIMVQVFSSNTAAYLSNVIAVLLSGLSGYVGNIILGVLGNFVTDLIKHVYKKAKKKSK